ncbi:hypothetical protein DFH06DRAFT_1405724 [Mycena polygramma]|nr:hypothetical protein DFH06DRAFT_1405724 [Mycena polygramma]
MSTLLRPAERCNRPRAYVLFCREIGDLAQQDSVWIRSEACPRQDPSAFKTPAESNGSVGSQTLCVTHRRPKSTVLETVLMEDRVAGGPRWAVFIIGRLDEEANSSPLSMRSNKIAKVSPSYSLQVSGTAAADRRSAAAVASGTINLRCWARPSPLGKESVPTTDSLGELRPISAHAELVVKTVMQRRPGYPAGRSPKRVQHRRDPPAFARRSGTTGVRADGAGRVPAQYDGSGRTEANARNLKGQMPIYGAAEPARRLVKRSTARHIRGKDWTVPLPSGQHVKNTILPELNAPRPPGFLLLLASCAVLEGEACSPPSL